MLLGLIGVIWLAYGWGLFNSPASSLRQFGHLPSLIDEVLSDHRSALLWALCGLTGIAAAVLPRGRMPDAYGFNALLMPPLIWTVLSGCSWLIFVITRGEFGSPRSWMSAVIWSAAVTVLLITSGWPDPDDADHPGEE
jgi:drug/metabolite transporter (DMT)-like permease